MKDLFRKRMEMDENILKLSALKKQNVSWRYEREEAILKFNISWKGLFGPDIARRVLQHHTRQLTEPEDDASPYIEIPCTEKNLEAAFAEAGNIQEQITAAEERLKIKIFELAGV